jgi:hypothetical protein
VTEFLLLHQEDPNDKMGLISLGTKPQDFFKYFN